MLTLYEYAFMHVQLSQRVLFQQLKQFYNHHFPLGIGMMQFSGSRYYPFSFFFSGGRAQLDGLHYPRQGLLGYLGLDP